jgi:DNA-binding NarL/FixJ family response regulator
MFKNAKKPRQNQVYRVFFEFHHGIKLSTSAITHRKKRVLKVLQHVGALLRFKRDNNIDNFLKDILTNKQYRVLVLYEKRKTLLDISHQLNIKPNTVSQVFSRMLHRLEQESHPLICRYRELLGIVLRYSYKRKI